MDLTRTAYPIELGTRHPLSIVKNEIIDIFHRLGFSIADGPEIEDDWSCFSSMNFAEDHPARDMQDTFFVEANPEHVQGNVILRTHTFIRTKPGNGKHPATHPNYLSGARISQRGYQLSCTCDFFHQVEALYIDKKRVIHRPETSIAFICEGNVRCRNSNPFTSFLLSPSPSQVRKWISAVISAVAKGCPFCKGTGWVETFGLRYGRPECTGSQRH